MVETRSRPTPKSADDDSRRRQPRRAATSTYKRRTSSVSPSNRSSSRRATSSNDRSSRSKSRGLRRRTAHGRVAGSRTFWQREQDFHKSTGTVKKRRGLRSRHPSKSRTVYTRDDGKKPNGSKFLQPLPKYFQEEVGSTSSADVEGALVAGGQAPLPQVEADKLHHEMIERDVLIRDIKTQWIDIAGLEPMKRLLQEACVLPFLFPKYFVKIRRPWRGVLLYGPPGVGKTMLARAVANECRTTFFNVSLATILSQWVGESEKLIRVLFEMARKHAPSTIFIDEFDAIFSKRTCGDDADASRRVRAEFMVQLDGLTTNADEDSRHIIVLAATNSPWDLEDAIRRRLEKSIYIPLPDLEAREHVLQLCMRGTKLASDVNFHELAVQLEGFSGADITSICRNAALISLRKRVEGLTLQQIKKLSDAGWNKPVTQDDFRAVLKASFRTVSDAAIAKYDKWTRENAYV